ncbi:MAG: glutamine synthetase beta-grasp domain-containing protein [Candidatus Aminicenantaceae bacterium]
MDDNDFIGKDTYGLAHSLSVFLNKPREDFCASDFLEVIKKKEIRRITFHYTALDGKLKELKLPVISKKQAELTLAEGERVDGSSLFPGIVDAGGSDLYVVPVYKTAFINPFDRESLDFICRYLDRQGRLIPFAPDNICSKASDLFKSQTGLELYALGELEFFLIYERERNIFPLRKQGGYHESSPFIKQSAVLNEMLYVISRITGSVKYVHSEVGSIDVIRSEVKEIAGKSAEQLEVEFVPRPIQEMADMLVLGRWLIRNIAYRHGCVATFIPKLEEGLAGNGLHFHLELRKNKKNIMVDSDNKLSKQAHHLIGGLCRYASSLTAFGNLSASSYLRLVPNQEAPTRICWSDMNRNVLIRVPLGWTNVRKLAGILNPSLNNNEESSESRQTIELRSPDGSALIHLILAGIALAAEWGFSNSESLSIAQEHYLKGTIGNHKKHHKNFPSLPSSCIESSQVLLNKRQYYEREDIFPARVIDYIVRLLQNENDEVINKKLRQLPEDSRLHEFRKIMHRDLHKH